MRCPCRKKSEAVAYAACCEPQHTGARLPPTPEVLMRSRYSAFALREADYLRNTWHASKRPARVEFNDGQEWLQLRIVAAATDGDRATVEFVARSRIGGASHILHETSRFVRENGRWFYVDGDIEQG